MSGFDAMETPLEARGTGVPRASDYYAKLVARSGAK